MKESLKEEWEVIRNDSHGNDFRFKRGFTEEEAKEVEEKENARGHHQKYYARPFLKNDPNILE